MHGRPSKPIRVNEMDDARHRSSPRVVLGNDGSGYLVWLDQRHGVNRVYGAPLRGVGSDP